MASLNQAGIDASAAAGGTHAVEFGASLREIRLAHQRELADVSADLRIRQVFLQAIEEGRFEDLPGPTYAVGFVRAYADYLGLEVEEVINRFKEMGGGVAPQTSLVPPSIVAEGRLPTGSVLLVAAVLAAAAYGGWYYLSLEGQAVDEGIAALPQRIAALVGMGTEPEEATVPPVSDEKPEGGGEAVAPAEPAPAQEAPPTAAPVTEQAATEQATTEQTTGAEPAEPAEAVAAGPAGGEAGPVAAETAAVAAETAPASGPSDSAAASTTLPPPPAAVSTTPPPAPAAAETPTAPTSPDPAQSVATESAAPPPEAPAAPKPVAAAPAATSQATSQATSGGTPAAATQQQEAAADAAPSPGNDTPAARQVAVTAAAGPRVTLRASASVWVEVREGSAEPMLSRLMHAGETFEIPARPGMVLTTGNAGGIEILIDGRALPPLGPTGAVRSNVALDAASLLKETRGAR